MRYAVRFLFISSVVLSILIFIKILFVSPIETWQISLLCLTLSLSFFVYLTLNPPIIRADDKTQNKRELPPDSLNDSDFLLIVSKEIDAGGSKDFSANNWGFFWISILEKEVGYFSMVDVSKLDKEAIKDKRVIIFSKGTTVKLNDKGRNALKKFCEDGGILLIEIPDSSIYGLTGIVLSDKGETAKGIDWIKPDFLSAFISMPLNTTIHSIEHKEHDVKTILKIDGRDAILERRVENGKVVMLCFDLSLQLLSMKQGIPADDDYRVKIGLNKNIRSVQTSDMAINKEMKRNLLPYADIFERFIMDITLRESNIPVWWYYPHNYKGASIISFDEDFYGDRLVETENVRGNRVFSYFIMSDSKISAETIKKLIESGDEIGIHWNRFYLHINRFGLHYARNKGLRGQINRLKTLIPPRPLVTTLRVGMCYHAERGNKKWDFPCRIHYLRWGNDYTDAFEIMDNADIYLDSSYGPGRDEWGYVFGTGFPFLPLNKDGIPFKLYEFPFHCHEPYGGMEENRFDKLMDESVNTFNTAIVYLFHPYHCNEGGVSYNRLIKAMDDMGGKRWITNFREYMSFYMGRKESPIKSNRLDNKICIDVDVKQDGMCISLRHFQKIKDIKLPFKACPDMSLIRNITGQASAGSLTPSVKTGILQFSKGKHRIEIIV